MGARVRLLGVVAAATLLSGCSNLVWMFEDPPPPQPPTVRSTPTPTPTPDERTSHPYSGKPAKDATCVRLDEGQLSEFERISLVGGAITYPRGAMVKANANWWAVAVAAQVNPNDMGLTSDSVPPYAYFVTNAPDIADTDFDTETFTWRLAGGSDEAAKLATTCVQQIPVPKPTPPAGSPESYTGKLAKNAKCATVDARMLAHLEDVGRVGGAITYPRGWMVKANGKWWTVAVATQVNPNSAGHTTENVPKTALFVTNDPSYKASSKARIVYFPLKPGKKDTAAAKALKCLGS